MLSTKRNAKSYTIHPPLFTILFISRLFFHRSCIRHRPTTISPLVLHAGNFSLPIILFVHRPMFPPEVLDLSNTWSTSFLHVHWPVVETSTTKTEAWRKGGNEKENKGVHWSKIHHPSDWKAPQVFNQIFCGTKGGRRWKGPWLESGVPRRSK